MSTFMECGHSTTAIKTASGKPVCLVCTGIIDGADVPATTEPDLTGRIARCDYGDHADVPSSTGLAFFSHKPDKPYDSYYCGCFGWN